MNGTDPFDLADVLEVLIGLLLCGLVVDLRGSWSPKFYIFLTHKHETTSLLWGWKRAETKVERRDSAIEMEGMVDEHRKPVKWRWRRRRCGAWNWRQLKHFRLWFIWIRFYCPWIGLWYGDKVKVYQNIMVLRHNNFHICTSVPLFPRLPHFSSVPLFLYHFKYGFFF